MVGARPSPSFLRLPHRALGSALKWAQVCSQGWNEVQPLEKFPKKLPPQRERRKTHERHHIDLRQLVGIVNRARRVWCSAPTFFPRPRPTKHSLHKRKFKTNPFKPKLTPHLCALASWRETTNSRCRVWCSAPTFLLKAPARQTLVAQTRSQLGPRRHRVRCRIDRSKGWRIPHPARCDIPCRRSSRPAPSIGRH